MTRPLFIVCGCLSITVAIVGIFVPLIPTTPLVLLSAYCFSRGSKRLHEWLTSHPLFGKSIRDWEQERVIPLGAKIMATVMIAASLSYPILYWNRPVWIKIMMGLGCAAVIAYIWSCPHRTLKRGPLREDR
ncbi:MAG: YbaN family protein [Deltaproteobacteria bacterium]|nr:YbaN family protein [Deltaproteobacteria bacterium]